MFLVLTDGLCWLPVCITSIISFAGYKVSDTMYIVSACILLPVNSVINPLIYSRFGVGLIKEALAWMLPAKTTEPDVVQEVGN